MLNAVASSQSANNFNVITPDSLLLDSASDTVSKLSIDLR